MIFVNICFFSLLLTVLLMAPHVFMMNQNISKVLEIQCLNVNATIYLKIKK